MARSIFSKVMWVGRATVFLMGLALMLALVFGMASTALGANGGNFILGSLNNTATAITKLTGSVGGGPALRVSNPSTATGSTALDLQVATGKAPMKVNSQTKVSNLNADKLDGKDSTQFANSSHPHSGADITSGTVEADRIEDGSGSNLDADQLDGRDSPAYLPGDLPGGTTVRGNFLMVGTAFDNSEHFFGDAISFGYRLPSVPSAHYIKVGEPVPAGCSGDANDPDAQPGHFCVFEEIVNGASPGRGIQIVGRNGAGLLMTSDPASVADGDIVSTYGSWAVTAANSP